MRLVRRKSSLGTLSTRTAEDLNMRKGERGGNVREERREERRQCERGKERGKGKGERKQQGLLVGTV
jgi:hypothetical protein